MGGLRMLGWRVALERVQVHWSRVVHWEPQGGCWCGGFWCGKDWGCIFTWTPQNPPTMIWLKMKQTPFKSEKNKIQKTRLTLECWITNYWTHAIFERSDFFQSPLSLVPFLEHLWGGQGWYANLRAAFSYVFPPSWSQRSGKIMPQLRPAGWHNIHYG